MTLTFQALCYLHAFEHRLPVQDGLAFESLVRATRLDYSAQSLERIDVLLDALRSTGKVSPGCHLDNPAIQNTLYLLAFYTGEVIGRSIGARPHWSTSEEVAAQARQIDDPPLEDGPAFEQSATLSFPDRLGMEDASYLPLMAITSRMYGAAPAPGVLSSARMLLAPEALQKPACLRPLPPVPGPAWPVAVTPVAIDTLTLDPSDDLLHLFDAAPSLLREGRVVWGAVVLADLGLLEPGPTTGAPGEILYDPSGRVPDSDLHAIARTVSALKGRNFDLPDLASIAQYLNDESVRVFGLDLPARLAPYPLKVSSTWFERRHLPGGVLAQPLIPVLVSDAHPGAVLPLPAAFWPANLREAWSPDGVQPMVEERVARKLSDGGYLPDSELAHLEPHNLAHEAQLWLDGDQVAQDYGKARMAWSKSAAAGNAEGLHGLGELYEHGHGVQMDLRRALAYYEQAAAKDHGPALQAAQRLRKLIVGRSSFLGRMLRR